MQQCDLNTRGGFSAGGQKRNRDRRRAGSPPHSAAEDAGPAGERRVAADDFFQGLYDTALEPDEVLVAAELPVATAHSWCAFDELARRRGDYAIVGMALTGQRRDGLLADTRVVLMGVDATPWRARRTEALLDGQRLDAALAARAAETLRGEIDPLPDLTNSPETKRHLAGVLLQRLLTGACA